MQAPGRHGAARETQARALVLGALLSRLAQAETPAVPAAPVAPLSVPPADGGLFSPGFFLTLGFSFIVGLAVGFALKIALKIALVVGGLVLLALFGLQYAGLIDVNWIGMEAHYDGFSGWLGAYAGGLTDYMADHLSNAASFAAGFLLGLRL